MVIGSFAFPSKPFWRIDKQNIRISYGNVFQDRVANWDISQIESAEVVEFTRDEFRRGTVQAGISNRFSGVRGYFRPGKTKGVLLKTKSGESFLLGFDRPNYADAVINRLIKK
jgi:hypothetical protein